MLRVSAAGMGDLTTDVHRNFEAGYVTGSAKAPARLTLVPEARIAGRVVTRLPGVSTAGLKIGLQNTNQSQSFWRETRTDADGRFEMHGLPEGAGNLFPIDHPADGPWTYRAIDGLALRAGTTSEVAIELIEGVLVEGKVLEAGTGKPITGISMGMYGPARPRSGAAINIAKTDENGRYRYRLPPGEAYLYLYDPGSWQPRVKDMRIPEAKAFTVPTFELSKAVTVPPDSR